MKILSPRIHSLLDYGAALGLIGAPWLLGFSAQGALAAWLSTGAGVGLICYSLITNYPSYSAVKILPLKAHLTLDVIAGLVFIAAPFVFGFTGIVQLYYIAQGVVVLALVSITNTNKPVSVQI